MSSISRQLWAGSRISQPFRAWPRPSRYGPQSQAFPPCRGSDPGMRDSRRRRREPAAERRAAAAARSRVSPDPLRLARPLTARSRPGLRLRHVGPAVEQCLHQNTRCRNVPRQRRSLAEQMVDGGMHEGYGAIAISTPSPLSAEYTSPIGNSPRLCSRRRNHVTRETATRVVGAGSRLLAV